MMQLRMMLIEYCLYITLHVTLIYETLFVPVTFFFDTT